MLSQVVQGVVCSQSVTHCDGMTEMRDASVMLVAGRDSVSIDHLPYPHFAGSIEYERGPGRLATLEPILAQEGQFLAKQVYCRRWRVSIDCCRRLNESSHVVRLYYSWRRARRERPLRYTVVCGIRYQSINAFSCCTRRECEQWWTWRRVCWWEWREAREPMCYQVVMHSWYNRILVRREEGHSALLRFLAQPVLADCSLPNIPIPHLLHIWSGCRLSQKSKKFRTIKGMGHIDSVGS